MRLRMLPVLMVLACTPDKPEGRCDSGLVTGRFADVDGDGFGDPGAPVNDCEDVSVGVEDNTDCDDDDASVNPSAMERCGGADDDCDGQLDDADDNVDPASKSTFYVDDDGDDYGLSGSTVLACAVPAGAATVDGDCDDTDDEVNPGEIERCDGEIDEDCDGDIDDADDTIDGDTLTLYWRDADGDGHGDLDNTRNACTMPEGYASNADDCDDGDDDIYPGAPEVCDNADSDEDCDGLADDDDDDAIDTTLWFTDSDYDGAGDPSSPVYACDGLGAAALDNDCDDTRSDVSPYADEVCDPDNLDEDCDGLSDDADADVDVSGFSTFYADLDGDGYGDGAALVQSCDVGAGVVLVAGDCDDQDGAVSPDGLEVCGGGDEDCDGLTDDADPGVDPGSTSRFYADLDGDGYGDDDVWRAGCTLGADEVEGSGDCDDTRAEIFPAAIEDCDGIDNNCDGVIDDLGQQSWYADVDADGYGDPTVTLEDCEAPAGYVGQGDDCDDLAPATNPGATETCDGGDEDCNGIIDDAADAPVWYVDADFDGFGDPLVSTIACDAPSGYVADPLDCDDTNSRSYPGATDSCDDEDNDCNGTVDDGPGSTNYYPDSDGDGYGAGSATPTVSCVDPPGMVNNGEDCEDTDSGRSPGGTEVCGDGVDQDCDGVDVSCSYTRITTDDADRSWTALSADTIGDAVTFIGDVNGDGLDDVALGSLDYGTNAEGRVFIVPGDAASGFTTAVDLWDYAEGGQQAEIGGQLAAADVTGDNVVDLLIGSSGDTTTPETLAFMVPSSVPSPLSGGHGIDVTAGVVQLVSYTALNNGSVSVAMLDDLDDDGIANYAIGVSDTAVANMGAVYAINGDDFGAIDVLNAPLSLRGDTASSQLGASMLSLDYDGDGFADLAAGAPDGGLGGGGEVWLLLGPMAGDLTLLDVEVVIEAGSETVDLGSSIASGDADGDGKGDLLIGDPGAGSGAGAVHLVAGRSVAATAGLRDIDGLELGRLSGTAGSALGSSVILCDLDGDAALELVASAVEADMVWSVTLSQVAGGLGSEEIDTAWAALSSGGQFGASIACNGDSTGDGLDDLLVGAPGQDPSAVWLFGG